MKKNLFISFCLAAILTSCSSGGYRIIGDLAGLEGDLNMLDVQGHTINSCTVENGRFEMTGTVERPMLVYLNNALGNRYLLDIPVILENEKIHVTGDMASMFINITGTRTNEEMVKFKAGKDRLERTDDEGYLAFVKEMFDANADNFLGALLITNLFGLVSDEELLGYCERVPEEFFADEMISHPREVARCRVNTSPGHTFVDFDVVDSEGNSMKLSDVAGRGDAVALVFWASWSRDVKFYLKDIAALCRQYSSQGMTMFTVSMDSDKGKWTQYSEDIGLFGYNFCFGPTESDREARKYGIDGMPRTIIIGPDGIIAARGKSVSDIREAVENIYEKKF